MAKLIIAIALFVLSVLFIFQNTSMMEVNFLMWQWESSRALVLIGVFLAGLIIGALLLLFLKRNKRKSTSLPPIHYS